MKVASQVLLILSGIISSVLIIFELISLFRYFNIETLSSVVFYILSITFAIIGCIKLSKVKTKKELIPIAICVLIFCYLVAGILMLCMQDKDLNPNLASQTNNNINNSNLNNNINNTYHSGAISIESTHDNLDNTQTKLNNLQNQNGDDGQSSPQ